MAYTLPFSKSSFVIMMMTAVFVCSLVQLLFYTDYDAPPTIITILAVIGVIIPVLVGLVFGLLFVCYLIDDVIPKYVKFKEADY